MAYAGADPSGFDVNGRKASYPRQADSAWLRLPCRALLKQKEAFRPAIVAFGKLAGPVLD